MTTPLLGDPSSLSALGASLRRTAVLLTAQGQELTTRLEEADPGWRGPRALALRRRTSTAADQTLAIAAALDETGRSLQTAASDLADAIGHLRQLEDVAAALGLEVREGAVTKGWGSTGVADPGAVDEEDRQRQRLQERVHQTVTTLGRRRARLADDLGRASTLLREASAELRA